VSTRSGGLDAGRVMQLIARRACRGFAWRPRRAAERLVQLNQIRVIHDQMLASLPSEAVG
jgi:hypothetical protein